MGRETTYCRLCLNVVSSGDGQAIEEIKKEMLQVLQINIDFNVTEDAVACSRCLKALQDCFDFKSTCVYTDDYIAPLVNSDVMVDNKKVFKKELVSNDNGGMENFQVCRLCTSVIEDEVFDYTTDTDSKVGVLKDFNTDHELSVCKKCLSNTKKYNEFRKTCHKVEQRIKNYCQVVEGYGITNRVSLDDILKFNNAFTKPEAIKKECSDIEFTDVKLVCPENKDIVSIKCEEIHIKDEVDTGVETEDFDELGDCSSPGNSGSSKETPDVRTSASKGKKQFCNKCRYSSETESDVIRHIGSHLKCTLCNFVADTSLSLKTHITSHRGPTKKYGRHECPDETNELPSLLLQLLRHKNNSQVKMHRCPSCPYKTKYRAALRTHQKVQHQQNPEMYKCKWCSFSTKYKTSLVNHQLRHMNPKKIPMYKCVKCEFETKYKRGLVLHMVIHEDPKVEKQFKCEKCEYRGKRKIDVKKHMMVHSDKSLFSCDKCTYSTYREGYLVRHKHRHHKDSSHHKCPLCNFVADSWLSFKTHMRTHRGTTNKYGCHECPYETNDFATIARHFLKHKDNSQVEMHKCPSCPYKTKYKEVLKGHQKLQHQENLETYKCKWCSFSTKYKRSFMSHQLVHMNPEEIPMYKCEKCKFETKRKQGLIRHMIIHEDPKVGKQFKCEKCDYWSKRQNDVKRHMMVHSDNDLFSCDKCTFSTNKSRHIIRHKHTHLKDSERQVYKCQLCIYKTKCEASLKRHMAKTHMNLSVPDIASVPMKL